MSATHVALFCRPGMPMQRETGYYDTETHKWVTLTTRDARPGELGLTESAISYRSTTPMSAPPTEAGQTGSSNQHARLAPSSSKSWTNCTAGPSFLLANSHRIREDDSSDYSREGTEAHEWATKVLLKQITLDAVPENFRPYITTYVAQCHSLVPEGATYMTEVQLPLFYQPEKTGTMDFGVVTNDFVAIEDLKYGAGVLVPSFENPQLAIYAYSLIKLVEDVFEFHPDTVVRMGIFQPRHREAADAQPWITTLKGLEYFCKAIEYASIQAHTGLVRVREKLPCGERNIGCAEITEAAPMVRFSPSDGDDGACRWCKGKSICEARLAAATEDIGTPERSGAEMIALLPDLSKEELALPTAERIDVVTTILDGVIVTDDYLVTLYARKKSIIRFLDDVEEYLESRVLAGEKIDGVKLVLGNQGDRVWADEDAADTYLKGQGLKEKERYNFKLLSPAQVEKIPFIKAKLKTTRTANRFAELITRSPARKKLALASDKREAVGAAIDSLPVLDAPDDWEP